jgi:hypothetical protein
MFEQITSVENPRMKSHEEQGFVQLIKDQSLF